MSWGYIWEVEHKDAGVINEEWFWKPIESLGRVVAYRVSGRVITEPWPWRMPTMRAWSAEGNLVNGHPVYGRAIPGMIFIQEERYPTEVME